MDNDGEIGTCDAPNDARDAMRHRLQELMKGQDQQVIEPLRTAIEAAEEIGLEKEELQPAVKFLQNLVADAIPATFTDLPRETMEQLQACTSRAQVLAILLPCLRLRLEDGFQSEILAEFHYHNFMFCQRKGFCTEKASTLISLLRALHSRAIVREKIVEREARELFEGMLGKHSRQLPPYSIGVFTTEDAAAVRAHTEKSFFRHYAMHAFVAHQRQDLVVEVSKESAAPAAPATASFHKRFDSDPRDITIKRQQTMSGSIRNGSEDALACEPAQPLTGTEADVHKAVEKALEAHLHRFEPPSL